MAQELTDDFDAFFRRDFGRLVAFLVKLGHRLPDAEDAAEEAMARLYASWGQVGNPGAWVRLVARRYALRYTRRDVKRVVLEAVAGRAEAVDGASEVEDVVWLGQVLALLSEREREVLVLTMEGFTAVEIARQLGVRPATVRSLLRNARARLAGRPEVVGVPRRGGAG